MKSPQFIFPVFCALVVGLYISMAQAPIYEPARSFTPDTGRCQYGLLVQGFQSHQLNLKLDAPPELLALDDPYDPKLNSVFREAPYKLHDLSYYNGKLYLYFGVAPALLFFWPFAAITRHYLVHREAVLVFFTIEFLLSTGLLYAIWRRYFAAVSGWIVAVCAVGLGLASGFPALLTWAGVYEVPISCGCMLITLSLGAIWQALHRPERCG